jgi:hypothetical protein
MSLIFWNIVVNCRLIFIRGICIEPIYVKETFYIHLILNHEQVMQQNPLKVFFRNVKIILYNKMACVFYNKITSK